MMNFTKVAWRDISSILKNRFMRISVIAIIIMPLLYSGCFLGAFWDPYSKLENIHIAVVNLDEGGKDGNKIENYGKDFVKKMHSNREMGWKFVGYKDATEGLEGNKYFAEIVIPKDFTKKILKVKKGKPQTPVIAFKCNEKKNFLMGQLTGKSLPDRIKAMVIKNMTEQSVKIAFDSLYEVKDGFKQAGEGSKKISDAVAEANDKVQEAKKKLDENQDVTALVTKENFDMLKKTLSDAQGLKDANTETLKKVPELLTSDNINAIKKINEDLKSADLEKLINDPMLKELPKLATKENLKNVNALMNDTDTLSKIDMEKLAPLLNLMKNEDKIEVLVNNAKKLVSSLDQKKLQPLVNLLSKKDQIMALVNQANKLSSSVDVSKLTPLVSLLQNSDKLFGLLNEANQLNTLVSSKELEPLINLAKNKDKFAPILADVVKLSSIDVAGIQDTLSNQVKGSQSFIDATSFLTQSNKDALKASVMTNTTLTADQKKQLITALEASSAARDTMISSAKGIQGLSENLNTLKNAQTDIKSLLPLVSSVPASIEYANAKVLPEVTKLQQGITESQALIKDVPSSVQYIKGLTPQLMSMYANLQTVKPLMTGVPESLTYVNGLAPQALSMYAQVQGLKPLTNGLEGSLSYVKTFAPKLLSMKEDLDKNAANLNTVKELLKKANDPNVKASLDKVMVLKNDVETMKPMMTQLQSLMTDENINKLSDAPALVNKLLSMQQELKDNEKVLEVAQNALTDENYNQAKDLIDSIPSLASNVQKLADGTKTLTDKLNEGYNKLNKNLVNKSSVMSKFIAEPMDVQRKPVNPVPNYGTGLAPYFIPLALWIGALLMFFVMKITVDNDIQAGPKSVVAGKYLSFGYIGIIQAIGVSAMVLALGLKPTNMAYYFLFNIFLSFTFIAIIQSLIFILGFDPGKFLALVLLILQLSSSGGTFPTQLIPHIFGIINPWLPFTYATQGLREIISAKSIDYSILGKDVSVLGAMLIVFLVISLLLKEHADKFQAKVEAKKEAAANA